MNACDDVPGPSQGWPQDVDQKPSIGGAPPEPKRHAVFGTQFPDAEFVGRVACVLPHTGPSGDERIAAMIGDGIKAYLVSIMAESRRFASHGRRQRVIPQDVDDALGLLGHQPLYGISSGHGEPFRYCGSMGKELVLHEEGDLDLNAIISAPPARMPPVPTVKTHWLVIDGEQPALPENPVPELRDVLPALDAEKKAARIAQAQANPTAMVLSPPRKGRGMIEASTMKEKTVATHNLLVEQQVYFRQIMDAIVGDDETQRNEALHCLSSDHGIQSILPRFTLAIVEGVRTNIASRNLTKLKQLMRMSSAILSNTSRKVNLQRSIHELLPSMISCVVSKTISARPAFDAHWALREFAAKTVARVCNTNPSTRLRTRVARVFTEVFTPGKRNGLATLYGALFALNELGAETVRCLIVPRAIKIHQACARVLQLCDEVEEAEQNNKEHVKLESSDAAAVEEAHRLRQTEIKMRREQDDNRKAAKKIHNLMVAILIAYVRMHRPPSLDQFGGYAEDIRREVATDMPPARSSTVPAIPPPSVQRPVAVASRSQLGGYSQPGYRGGSPAGQQIMFRRQGGGPPMRGGGLTVRTTGFSGMGGGPMSGGSGYNSPGGMRPSLGGGQGRQGQGQIGYQWR